MNFKGRKIIVTGASSGIGKAIAKQFLDLEADVAITYRTQADFAESLVENLKLKNQKFKAFQVDFLDNVQIKNFSHEAINYLGSVDILINNAGMLCREKFFELTPQKMDTVFQVNTIAPFYLAQLCALHMKENGILGSIINISSIAATTTLPKGVGYASSKSAMNKWTKNAALNLAEYNIRVNAIAPGVIQSGMNENTSETDPELWAYYQKNIPLKRTGTPKDIVEMVLFLASEKSSWITGKVFEVDGGQVM
jgi:NAD(P)-dependent dehydrogenase (short-subunit alcohol dehydrogenase family)